MSKKQIRQMVTDLTEKLCEKEFLERSGLSKKNIVMLMNREHWEEQLGRLIPIKKRISCRLIYEICEEPMELLGNCPEEGWMKFTYQYVCHILYPDKEFSEQYEAFAAGAECYLAVLKYFFDMEREVLPYDHMYDFAFLSDEEAEKFESYKEYRRFKRMFAREYVYEMMRLNAEVTPFRTLQHIAGVHHVAMTVARGLYAAGVPIDLTLTSGAAAGHDLGKFGCKPNERVPYLHYYYTDQWFHRHSMDYIGHIAANHSTWDLEPENLSVESLALIYADFRVKQKRDEQGREITFISDLDEAFHVILSKLDNVDEAKKQRYRFVYSRLHDFEDYMKALGVDVKLNGHPEKPERMPDISLRNPEETIRSLVFMGIEHNIDVMHQMGAERQFGNLLEAARSEKNWKNVRAYLNIFDEYFTYTNDKQKEQTLGFLYELLMHREGDIRTQAGRLIGKVIALFNAGYRKERPAQMPDIAEARVMNLWNTYLKMIIRPDHKLTGQQKRRIRYHLKNVLDSLVQHAGKADLHQFLEAFLAWYREPEIRDNDESFVLLDTVHFMPFDKLSEEELGLIGGFALAKASSEESEVRIAAWRAFKLFTAFNPAHPCCQKIAACALNTNMTAGNITMVFLQYRVLNNLGYPTDLQQMIIYDRDVVSDIFLDNLKTATPWIIKAVNIKLLADQIDHGKREHILHIAAHLSNLIKVSEHVMVRHDAGDALLRIIGLLSPDQRNEVVVELLKGLEVGEYEFSKYIPRYLGECALWLPPAQLEEIISHLNGLMASPNDQIVSVALDTVGILLECYPCYKERFEEEEAVSEARRVRLQGLLLGGLANYRETVRQEALLVLGQTVFGSSRLNNEEKNEIFMPCCKKILFLINENKGGALTSYYRASALSNITRFITAYRMTIGEFESFGRDKVAFFPGTFDPFTLSHKEIVRTIRDMGFEVFLSVDEFSWSKKAQPHFIRRQIVNMSVAGEFHVHVFPYDFPVNPGNPSDLKKLKEAFPGKEVYMVVGSDVIANASFYKKDPEPHSIHGMNHIAFRRVGDKEKDSRQNPAMMKRITGKVCELELPENLEDISSTKIRENVDMNRDISNLIDPSVQEYIYNNGLYLREPEYKPIIRARAISFEEVETPEEVLLEEISQWVLHEEADHDLLLNSMRESGDHLLLLRNAAEGNRLVGVARIRYLASDALFAVLKQVELADLVRRHTSGEILLISGIYVDGDSKIPDAEQLLLTEAIARSFMFRCGYALFFPADGYCPGKVLSAVLRQGFVKAPEFREEAPLFLVDMHEPLVLLQNLETTFKEPFSSNERVLKAVYKAHQELQQTMVKLYPGQLVLSLTASVIYHRLVDKITALNEVPREPLVPRQLGEAMCVPFGKILRGKVIPNTVTKTLHTDKVYEPDLKTDSIEAFPYYAPLSSQIKAIKSFNRPVILVDDLLHRGGRFEALEPMLKKENVNIKKVVLGVISGYGRDTMVTKGVDVDSVYYIPNLRHWFVESTIYPFIGGDTVRRDTVKVAGLTPSVNLILPYTVPPLKDCNREALFEFSACCIRNARDIFMVLESEYRAQFSRNLTLGRLSEAVILPLCPDKGECVNYDPNLAASVYLENDLQMLYRTKE